MAFYQEDDDYTENLIPTHTQEQYSNQIKNLSSKFLDFKRKGQLIDELYNLLPNRIQEKKGNITPTIESYNKINDEITILKKNLEENIDSMDNELKQKAENVINKIDNDLDEYRNKMKMKILDLENKKRELDALENDNKYNSNINKKNDYLSENIQIHKLDNNSKYLEKRKEELLNIQQIASQVNSLTKEMNENVEKQGEMINNIEDSIEEMEKNVDEGHRNIKEIARLQRSNRSRLYCIIFIIIFVIAVILIILYSFFKDRIFTK